MIVTVLEHMPSVPLDRFAAWLAEAADAPEVRLVRLWARDAVPSVEECEDGLIVLGGQQHAYDDAGSPWLPAVRSLLAEAAASGLPTLGICLGAQLLAAATGGRVQVAAPPGREAGVIDVHPRPEAATDALLGGLAADVPADHPLNGGVIARMPSMHADAVVELPRGATWLASSRLYPYQAFRVGDAAWGLQFHPEVSVGTFAAWAELHDDVATDDVVAQLEEHAAAVERAGRALAHAFVDVMAAASVGAETQDAELAG